MPVPTDAGWLQRGATGGSTVTNTNLKELFEMHASDYNNEWEFASDVLGCATLLAARRKQELDIEILSSEGRRSHLRLAEAIKLSAHVEGLLTMFPDEVVQEATHVVEFILKRWDEQ